MSKIPNFADSPFAEAANATDLEQWRERRRARARSSRSPI